MNLSLISENATGTSQPVKLIGSDEMHLVLLEHALALLQIGGPYDDVGNLSGVEGIQILNEDAIL